MRRNFTADDLLDVKDAGAVAASAAATVDGAAQILDVGAGSVEGQYIIDITSIETDGSAAQGTLTLDTNPIGAVAAQGTLTVDTNPTGAVASQGTLTMDTNPTDGNTMTIGSTTYRFKDTMAQAEDIQIGLDVAATQASLLATVNGTGAAGTDYYAGSTSPHGSVTMGAWASDDSVITANTKGAAGDSIATTETFTAETNVFDAATLGTTTAGVDGDTFTIGSTTYTFEANGGLTDVDGNIEVGSDLATTQTNIVNAITLGGTPGTGYAASMTVHPTVTIGSFAADAAVLTATTKGTAGNSIATTETFTAGTNVFDAATLGTTTAGVAGDTMTIDSKTYTFEANGGLTDVDGNIEVGGTLGATQTNIVNAITLGGTPGTGYAASTTLHSTVTIAAFATNAAVLTAKTKGVAGDSIATTETFTAGTNVFDGTTLGETRAGTAGDERFDLLLQGSNSSSFASGIQDLAAMAVGAAAVINGDIATPTGRIILPFANAFMGTRYRYVRGYTVVAGEHVATGINYKGRLSV